MKQWKPIDDKCKDGNTYLFRNSAFPLEIISAAYWPEYFDYFSVIGTKEISFSCDSFDEYCEILQ